MVKTKSSGKTKWTFQEPREKFEVRDIRDTNRFVLDDKFLNGYARFVGIHAVGVYAALCRHANKEQKSWPSIKKMAEELAISEPMVVQGIKYLVFWKIIKKKRVGKQCTNRYFLIDKKHWRVLSEVNVVKFTDVNVVKFRTQQGLIQGLTQLNSNSKETQEKGNTIERKGLKRFKTAKDVVKEKLKV